MEGQLSKPEPISKIGQIEARIDHLLGSSARIEELSAKISDRLLGPAPTAESEKDTKEPKAPGRLEAIRDHLDNVVRRLSLAEIFLNSIDKGTG